MKDTMKQKVVTANLSSSRFSDLPDMLERHGFQIHIAPSLGESIRVAEMNQPLAILLGCGPADPMVETIRRLKAAVPRAAIVVLSESTGPCVRMAMEAMQAGADEYLFEPVDMDRVIESIEACRTQHANTNGRALLQPAPGVDNPVRDIIGECPAIRDLRSRILQIGAIDRKSQHPRPVLVTGETGTGKQLVARALHLAGDRAKRPFVEINCGAIPGALLEAELFGYEKGAFTDAKSAKAGLFEEADGGTLFLDEICSMDPLLQVKLLKVIEDKQVRRIGRTKAVGVNVRIIAASNWVGELALKNQKIRPDLYYRLHAFSFSVPPLRERGEDIGLLARYTLDRLSHEFARPLLRLSLEAEAALYTYRWPGNVRELIHTVERASLLHEGDILLPEHLNLDCQSCGNGLSIGLDGKVQVDFSKHGIDLQGVERQLIIQALVQAEWNRTKAARLLGISKETLRYRMEKFRLVPPDQKNMPASTARSFSLLSPAS